VGKATGIALVNSARPLDYRVVVYQEGGNAVSNDLFTVAPGQHLSFDLANRFRKRPRA
jgi:hypothetical protein